MTEAGGAVRQYPAAMVNITNKCNLRCKHCFIFREGSPNDPTSRMDTPDMLRRLAEIQRVHGIHTMLWMGGEPLLRPDVLREGVKIFPRNNVTTNGTLDLIDLPNSLYVISIDGPPDLNDAIRGNGTFGKIMRTLSRVPEPFGPTVTAQSVVTRTNEDRLEELVDLLRPTRVEGMTFSFYSPPSEDHSDLGWKSLEQRDRAVREVMRLKRKYPDFVWNKQRSLDLTLSDNARSVTDKCPAQRYVLPLYLEGSDFVS